MKENFDFEKQEKKKFTKNENSKNNQSNFNFEMLKTIFDDIQLGLCIVEKQFLFDSTNLQNKKALEVQYYNKMFLDLLQLNIEEEQELKSKDILKIFKEFIFLNEDEISTPFSNHSKNSNKNNANSNKEFNNIYKNKPRSVSKENIKVHFEKKKSEELSDNLNRSKEKKDNFNNYLKSNSITNIINNNNGNNNNNYNFLDVSNMSFKNLNKIHNGKCGNTMNNALPNKMSSSNSLKFVSRKSKMLRALDLYDVLVNYLISSKDKETANAHLNHKNNNNTRKVYQDEKADVENSKNHSTTNFKLGEKLNIFGGNDFRELESSDKENIKLKNLDNNLNNNYENNPSKKYNNNNNKQNFKNTKYLPTKIREVKEFRLMRQNFLFSVRIQEIENFLVLIFENLNEEKNQIQNNLIKSIKNQYIITISHELNNPLNGLIHCIEELDFDEEEKKKLVVKKIKRFKFMIKFFLKNIITNFKFFLNEPIKKKSSNISFGFILESIKRSLFEFYEYKNIAVVHDFSNLNRIVLQYDYFYFRYLLKNIFMYLYYKIPRNGKLVIEIEKENEILDPNNLIMGNDTSELDSDSSNQSGKIFCKSDDDNEKEWEKINDNLLLVKKLVRDLDNSKNKTKRKIRNKLKDNQILSNNNINYNKQVKKKINMIFKTEQQSASSKKSSKNIFDKEYLENFDIENSVQTLEMLIESINKISKLLGIKVDFSNFSKKNSSIQMNLNYYIDEEEDMFSCDDVNEYNEEYEKYKANCVFSINRTLINEEKKIFLNPTLNMMHLGNKFNNNNNNINICVNQMQQHFKMLNTNLNGAYNEPSSAAKPYAIRTFNSFDNNREISPIANLCNYENEKNSNQFLGIKNRNNNDSSNLNFNKLNYLSNNSNSNINAVCDSSNVDTNANAADIISRNRSRALSTNSMYLSANDAEANNNHINAKINAINDDVDMEKNNNNNNDFGEIPVLPNFKNEGKIFIEDFDFEIINNKNLKNKSGFIAAKEKTKIQPKTKSSFIGKEKHETSLFSKQNTTKNLEHLVKFNSTEIASNIPKIQVSQLEEEIEKEKFGTDFIPMRRQNIYIEEALENNSFEENEEKSESKKFIKESLLEEESIMNKDESNSLLNFRKQTSLERNIVRERAHSEHMISLGFSESNSFCFNNSMLRSHSVFGNNDYNLGDNNIYQNSSFDKDDVFKRILDLKENLGFLKNNRENRIENKTISEKKNNQIFYNTYNTYLNIDNVEKLNVIGSSNKNKNNANIKDDLLKRYCNIKSDKKNESNNFISTNNNPDKIRNNLISEEDGTKKIHEAVDLQNNSNNKNNNNNHNKNKQNNLKHLMKNIENIANPSIFNFTAVESPNTNNQSESETNAEDLNECYDTYDQNINNNKDSIKLNHPKIMKSPFGNSNQMLNINFIRSPRLFFQCKIPNMPSSKRRGSALSINSSKKSSKKKCACNDILLVDDELFNLSSMKFLLKKKKLKADTAMNGRESILKIEEKLKNNCAECAQPEYKLVFMDILMPEMDGIEASKVIEDMVRKEVLSENMKILILTAHDFDIIKKRADKINVIKEFIAKPVKKSVVDELLNKHYFTFAG